MGCGWFGVFWEGRGSSAVVGGMSQYQYQSRVTQSLLAAHSQTVNVNVSRGSEDSETVNQVQIKCVLSELSRLFSETLTMTLGLNKHGLCTKYKTMLLLNICFSLFIQHKYDTVTVKYCMNVCLNTYRNVKLLHFK